MQKKIMYISGLSAASVAGFCLTVLLTSNTDTQHSSNQLDSSLTSSTKASEESYIEKVTPETLKKMEDSGLVYEEKTDIEEQHALEQLEAKTAEAYGKEFGLDPDEAAKRMERQLPLADSIQSIVTQLSDDELAGWGVDHENGQVGWVALTDSGEVTSDIRQVLDANPDIEIRHADHSYKKLQETQLQLTEVLLDNETNTAPSHLSDLLVHTDIDVDNNRMTVALDENAEIFKDGVSKNETLAAARDYFASISDVPVDVVLAPAPSASVLSTFVGGYAFLSCTSGFTVKHSSGALGVITAGHCFNIQVGNGGGIFKYVAEHFFGPYDVQLHEATFGAKVSPYFAYGRGQNQFIKQTGTLARNKMKGMWVCNHGWLSGYSCGTVNSTNYRPSGSNYPARLNFSFVRIQGKNLRGCGGDSGGPVFIGGTALGIISGGVSDSGPHDCTSKLDGKNENTFFASINENLSVFDLKLLTR